MSDQLNSISICKLHSLSSDSFNLTPKLQTIPSGKEVIEALDLSQNHPELFLPKRKNANRLKKRRETKSLSELEFEELRGFMDLGFVFSGEDKDSKLASIVPGLNRLGKRDEEEEEEGDFDESAIPRPYLSEAWEFLERKEKEKTLMNWRVPDISNEIIMKDNLKWWAHAVASSVR